MDQILDTQTYQQNRPTQYAGFWIRVAANIIDGIILSVIFWILIFFLGFIAAEAGIDPDLDPDTLAAGVIGFYVVLFGTFLLYYSIMESSTRQATLGKMAVGIKVADEHGNKISFGNALGRTASKFISQLILCIGYMMVGWDDRKQGLHDKIADTYVYYKN